MLAYATVCERIYYHMLAYADMCYICAIAPASICKQMLAYS